MNFWSVQPRPTTNDGSCDVEQERFPQGKRNKLIEDENLSEIFLQSNVGRGGWIQENFNHLEKVEKGTAEAWKMSQGERERERGRERKLKERKEV